jgi:hypothetical protein
MRLADLDQDLEAQAMDSAMRYLNMAADRDRERFMYHLQHKYFPNGNFTTAPAPSKTPPRAPMTMPPMPIPKAPVIDPAAGSMP